MYFIYLYLYFYWLLVFLKINMFKINFIFFWIKRCIKKYIFYIIYTLLFLKNIFTQLFLLNLQNYLHHYILLYKIILLLIIFISIIFLSQKLSFFNISIIFSIIWFSINITSITVLYNLQFFNKNISYFFFLNINNLFFNKYNIMVFFNKTNLVYIIVVSIISVFANITTINYMKYDQKKESFLILLNMFSISMLFLVLTKNLLVILLSWEFLGITSFFLIYHYDLKSISKKSALKAFSFNRISDLYLILASIIYFIILGNFNTNNSNLLLLLNNNNSVCLFFFKINIKIIFLTFIFLASIIKSTQIGTHIWLPDSMEAPLPASALIHSATLIAAGFYLILHFYSIFINFYFFLNIFLYLGLITAVYGSIIASYQNDLKKILAYSTIGNCGFMLTLLSLQQNDIFLIYFTLHGFFKSISFMSCGFFIESFKHSQDNRKKNNFFLKKDYFFLILIQLISSLGGLPITFLFFIKHLFFIKFFNNYILLNFFLKMYSLFSIMYSINFIYNTLYNYSFFKNKKKNTSKYIFIFYYFFYIIIFFLMLVNYKFFNTTNVFNKTIFLENILYIDFFFILFFFKFFKNIENNNKYVYLFLYLFIIYILILKNIF